jgi:translation elongation factor EF-1beta
MTKWINEAVIANTDPESGKVDLEKLDEAIKASFPEHAIPKAVYNSVAVKLKAANETLAKLQEQNKDVEALQNQITEYKEKVRLTEKELIDTKNLNALREMLAKAGAQDVDYMIYKLGELETDKDGSIKDLDSKIKDLQEKQPKWFEAKTDNEQNSKSTTSYRPLDNKLNQGTVSDSKTEITKQVEAALESI